MSNEEYYYLVNTTTKLYFKNFNKDNGRRNKPIWVEKKDCQSFPEMEALRLQRRLETQ